MNREGPTTEDVPAGLKKAYFCEGCGSPMVAVPPLRCGHCGHDILPRCFVYGHRPSGYIAECIDLNLLSQGETQEQAILRLQEAIYGYLCVVYEAGGTRGLVLRKSPLSHRLRYHARRFFGMLKHVFSGGHGHVVCEPGADTRFCHL